MRLNKNLKKHLEECGWEINPKEEVLKRKLKSGIYTIIMLTVLLVALFYMARENFELTKELDNISTDQIYLEAKQAEYKLVRMTMYNLGDPSQTDSTPCEGSSMVDLCQLNKYMDICASNCYPMGTILERKDGKQCVVLDKMNKRYTENCGTEWEILDWAVGLNENTYSGLCSIRIIKQ